MKKLLFFFALLAGMVLFVPPAAADPPDGEQLQLVTTIDHADLFAPDAIVLAYVPACRLVDNGLFLPQIPDTIVADLADAFMPEIARPPDISHRPAGNDQYLSSDKTISIDRSGYLHQDPG
ncbi:MAG: hypothetical protein PF694_09250 [Bacteroidetes bacterium]|jgi:hypothetical protein|nr:hypothetical protein [Bacteroidota bacterium]